VPCGCVISLNLESVLPRWTPIRFGEISIEENRNKSLGREENEMKVKRFVLA
jgi:hypothetical protein